MVRSAPFLNFTVAGRLCRKSNTERIGVVALSRTDVLCEQPAGTRHYFVGRTDDLRPSSRTQPRLRMCIGQGQDVVLPQKRSSTISRWDAREKRAVVSPVPGEDTPQSTSLGLAGFALRVGARFPDYLKIVGSNPSLTIESGLCIPIWRPARTVVSGSHGQHGMRWIWATHVLPLVEETWSTNVVARGKEAPARRSKLVAQSKAERIARVQRADLVVAPSGVHIGALGERVVVGQRSCIAMGRADRLVAALPGADPRGH